MERGRRQIDAGWRQLGTGGVTLASHKKLIGLNWKSQLTEQRSNTHAVVTNKTSTTNQSFPQTPQSNNYLTNNQPTFFKDF